MARRAPSPSQMDGTSSEESCSSSESDDGRRGGRGICCCFGGRRSQERDDEDTDDEDLMVIRNQSYGSPEEQLAERGVIMHAQEAERIGGGGRGLGGMGASATGVSSNLGQGRAREGQPQQKLDLRRFLRAGDILNYQGGNKWGHVVLILATPKVVQVPVLWDAEEPSSPSSKGKVKARDQPKELDRNVNVFLCKVLQSASNMPDINVSSCALIIHPDTAQICAVKEAFGGVRICSGKDGYVTTELLMSPFSNRTLDYASLHLAIEEVHRVPQDTKWSFKTAVRSYLRSATLWNIKYRSAKSKRRLAESIGEKWRKRPVCSTVPPRVWQKYLLKLCYKKDAASDPRSPLWRPQSAPLLHNGHSGGDLDVDPADDAKVAWAKLILEYMPVKDDRVLPAELVKILVEGGQWQRVDLKKGPPRHRLDDIAPPAEADLYNRARVPPFTRPQQRLANLKNGEGRRVWLGQNNFNVYCGVQYEKPKQIENRLGHDVEAGKTSWDGRCGPMSGPQCAACRWLEDTLPA